MTLQSVQRHAGTQRRRRRRRAERRCSRSATSRSTSRSSAGFLQKTIGQVRAVDDVSFTITQGETLALVGESGCGKTTTVALRPARDRADRRPDPVPHRERLRGGRGATVPQRQLRPLRRQMQMIFQDPFSSLNPRMTLLDIVGEPLLVNGVRNRQERIDRVERAAAAGRAAAGVHAPLSRTPSAAASGSASASPARWRCNPSLVVADEPVSALDVSVQAQILNLLLDLQERARPDLPVRRPRPERGQAHQRPRGGDVRRADGRDGRDATTLFATPKHPYTEALLSAVPKPDPRARAKRITLQGEVANPAAPPSGCYFHPRCPFAVDRCKTETPAWRQYSPRPLGALPPLGGAGPARASTCSTGPPRRKA